MNSDNTYTLSVGKADEERLNIQCRLCNPLTERFRKTYLPDLVGKTILDVGCGTGVLSCYWAQEVGPTGKVIALDISAEQLAIAKANADRAGLNNIEFLELNISQLGILQQTFDLVYCRFVLMHLPNPEALLRAMLEKVKQNGYLFCEECMSYEAFFSDPASNAFDAWKNLVLKLPLIYNTDFFIGKRLYSLYANMSLKHIEAEICQPIIRNDEDKGYFYLGFTEDFKQKFVDKGLASLEEINQILENLKAEMSKNPWIATAVQQMQIVGQKL